MAVKCFYSITLMLFICGTSHADEFYAKITQVENNKVTFFKVTKSDNPPTPDDAESLPLAKECKVYQMRLTGAVPKPQRGIEIKDGFKDAKLKSGVNSQSGLSSKIITDKDGKEIEEVWTMTFPKAKPK